MLDELTQMTPKAEIHAKKKIFLLIWWDYKGILHFELLPRNQTINSTLYVQQPAKLSDAVCVLFSSLKSAKPHTSLVTQQTLWN